MWKRICLIEQLIVVGINMKAQLLFLLFILFACEMHSQFFYLNEILGKKMELNCYDNKFEKEGVWYEYGNLDGKDIIGSYSQGQKNGVWLTFVHFNQIELVSFYKNDSLLASLKFTNGDRVILDNINDTIFVREKLDIRGFSKPDSLEFYSNLDFFENFPSFPSLRMSIDCLKGISFSLGKAPCAYYLPYLLTFRFYLDNNRYLIFNIISNGNRSERWNLHEVFEVSNNLLDGDYYSFDFVQNDYRYFRVSYENGWATGILQCFDKKENYFFMDEVPYVSIRKGRFNKLDEEYIKMLEKKFLVSKHYFYPKQTAYYVWQRSEELYAGCLGTSLSKRKLLKYWRIREIVY